MRWAFPGYRRMFVVRRQKSHRDENGMKEFIAKFGDQINGVLSGFDRLVFRGHLRGIAYVAGMKRYLWANQVLLKNFGEHADQGDRPAEGSLVGRREGATSPGAVSSLQQDQQRGSGTRHRRPRPNHERTGVRAHERGAVLEL